jgi:hypothetical protein
MAVINYIHAFGIAPMLGYIVYRNLYEEKVLPKQFSIFLAILVAVMFLFHLSKLTSPECKDK